MEHSYKYFLEEEWNKTAIRIGKDILYTTTIPVPYIQPCYICGVKNETRKCINCGACHYHLFQDYRTLEIVCSACRSYNGY